MALFHVVLLFLGSLLSLLLNLVMLTYLVSSSIASLPGDENDWAKKELKSFQFP